MIAYLFLASKNFISPNPRGFLPRPLLRAGNQIRISPEKISLGFAKSKSPENSFGKTESTELALEFRQFLLWRNPTSPATTIPKKENGSRGKSKQNAWWRGEGGATERERRNTVVPDSILKWTLRRDGIRRGAYDYISHYHARGACEVITSLCFENRFGLGTINTQVLNLKEFWRGTSGRRKAPTKDFLAGLQGNSEFLARKRARFSRQEAGAKSEAILTHSICLIQKEFLLL